MVFCLCLDFSGEVLHICLGGRLGAGGDFVVLGLGGDVLRGGAVGMWVGRYVWGGPELRLCYASFLIIPPMISMFLTPCCLPCCVFFITLFGIHQHSDEGYLSISLSPVLRIA